MTVPAGGRVAVLAGRGKTGRAVVRALSRRGIDAHPVGREAGADLRSALAGAEAVYVIAPNMCADEPAYVAEVLAAAEQAGVRRLGYHSVTAPYAPEMPHHLGKAAAEDVVRRGGLPWTVLQPCAYVQNFLPALSADPPVLRVPYDPARRFGLVDLEDVAEAAAVVLTETGHDGATYELGGPALVSLHDVAEAAARVLAAPVELRPVRAEEWARTDGAELDERSRSWLLAMFGYYDRHGLPTGSVPLRALLGREPRAVHETLVRELAGGTVRS